MHAAMINFDEIPKIGFAHHFYTDKYAFTYSSQQKSFEIVYVKSGGIIAELYNHKIYAPEGSVFVLFRHLPVKLSSIDNLPQSHCTVQVAFEYEFTLLEESDEIPDSKGILLPFVTYACPETEYIKNELYSIVSDMGTSRGENNLACSLSFLNIMRILDKHSRKKMTKQTSPSSLITHKVKKYITENINKNISLNKIGHELNLTPGYINHTFKAYTGIPVKQYVNNEKIKKIAELIQNRDLTFKTACLNVGIDDISYGYRMFKKHTGVTPGEFLAVSLKR